jgi:Bacterial archaeo-eukaryotic release factor family 10
MTEPTTLSPSPDALRDTIRRLAEVESLEMPILSIYLDVRPDLAGAHPGRRAAFTVLRDRLTEIEEAYWPRGDDYASFALDRERINELTEQALDPATQGLAIFACTGLDVWEVVTAGVPFRLSVGVGPRAELFQLARLIDEHETVVVAHIDAGRARLWVQRFGNTEEAESPDGGMEGSGRARKGGWSQARFQRRADNQVEALVAETATAIDRLVEAEDAHRLVLAGEETVVARLEAAITPPVRQRVGEIGTAGRAGDAEVEALIRPAVVQLEADEGRALADEALGLARAGGLGVSGAGRTRRFLELGAVDTLVLLELPVGPPEATEGQDARDLHDELAEVGDRAPLDLDVRNELVRLAALTSADVQVVDAHEGLERSGGVAGLLRYRPS